MFGGIDVAKQLASNQFRGKKLSSKGGVAGHSQGGIGAQLVAAGSELIGAVVDLQGGGAFANHATPALLLTGSTDFMRTSVYSAYSMLRGPSILYNYSGADHIMAPRNHVGYRASAAQFFRWQLINDSRAYQAFSSCLFCSGAEVKTKNFN